MDKKEFIKILSQYYNKDSVASILTARMGINIKIAGELYEKYQIPPNIFRNKEKMKLFLQIKRGRSKLQEKE